MKIPLPSIYCIDPIQRKQSACFVLSHDSSLLFFNTGNNTSNYSLSLVNLTVISSLNVINVFYDSIIFLWGKNAEI